MSDVQLLEVYEDEAGEWRWRGVAGNNQIVATSGEGYTRKEDAARAASEVFPDMVAQIVEAF